MTTEKLYGYTGSGIFCLLIVLFLFLTVLRTTVKAGEEGILVNFGNVNLSSGTFEPKSGEPKTETNTPQPVQQTLPAPETQPAVQQQTQNNTAPAVTQEIENTAAIEAARKAQEEKNRREAELQAQRQKEVAELQAQREKEAEEQRKLDAINKQVANAFGSGTSGQNQQGTATAGSGVQGNPQSTSPVGTSTGTGYKIDLGGRGLAGNSKLPTPDYPVQEEGTIVVEIRVSPNGDVNNATVRIRGTNIDNNYMRQSAREAALKAKFVPISGNTDQIGTISYTYRLK